MPETDDIMRNRRWLAPPWQGKTAGGFFAWGGSPRRAFSLAEVMIAIGILGVGLLMVAATFPVGIDQSRIVSEQTVAPLVASDAFEVLTTLFNEPDSLKRFPRVLSPSPSPLLADWFSFRQLVRQIANADQTIHEWETTAGPQDAPARAFLGVDLALEPSLTVPPPYQWTNLNELLVAPYISAGMGVPPASAGLSTRFYPSMCANLGAANKWSLPLKTDALGQPVLVDPPYTWSALYRVYTTVVVPAEPPPPATPTIKAKMVSYIQFLVFVNRRGSSWPRDWPQPLDFFSGTGAAAINPAGTNEIWFAPNRTYTYPAPYLYTYPAPNSPDSITNNQLFSQFSEGGFLVHAETGKICKIKEVRRAKNLNNSTADANNPDGCHQIVLDQVPTTTSPFWFIPADTDTGRSPCIAVYSRVYPL